MKPIPSSILTRHTGRDYVQSMNTTTATQNQAHRTDAEWVKTPGRSHDHDGEHFISEYRNPFTGQTIRKSWRMTGRDWHVFNAAGALDCSAHSLTAAKYDASQAW